MKIKFYVIILLLLSNGIAYSQTEVGKDLFAYGALKESIVGKSIIYYNLDIPKDKRKIVDRFNKKGGNAILWESLFIPGVKYTDKEIDEILKNSSINTIVYFRVIGTSTVIESSGNFYSSSWRSSTYENTDGVSISTEIYDLNSESNKPKVVIRGDAGRTIMGKGNLNSISFKIIMRNLKAFKKYEAFKE